ncbi:MAG: UDP-N-acetylglucosamine--N-acetylmuramyl-(pentapeptide) pyrophosphoryl-undecaprenol N-acetylglucosamine transferase, partial [Acidimicrobiales bacterium]
NLRAVSELGQAVCMAILHFARWRPAVVVSTGGYASVPGVLAAAVWRVPVVVVSLDAVPGLANRLAAREAKACAVAWEGTPLPRAVLTGVPVRPEMCTVDRSQDGQHRARERLGLPAKAKVVMISGGSLGASRLNQATVELAALWAERDGIALRHVVGARDWDKVQAVAPATDGLVYQRVRYEEDMASAYAAADVAVQRAGASTVAELVLAGLPALLVPLPGAPGDHQMANAEALARAGAAVVVADGELDGARLAQELEKLLYDGERLARMAEAGRALAKPRAADQVAELVEAHARTKAPGRRLQAVTSEKKGPTSSEGGADGRSGALAWQP